MKYFVLIFLSIGIISCQTEQKKYASTQTFRLAAPILKADSVLFKDSTMIDMNFAFEGGSTKYTLDGSDVTQVSNSYSAPFYLKKKATLKAKNFHPDFQESFTAFLNVARVSKNISDASVSINRKPHQKYKAKGAKSLTDLQKGTLQFTAGNTWLGFEKDTLNIKLSFSNKENIGKILVSTMSNHNSWIFLPKNISISSNGKEVGSHVSTTAAEQQTAQLRFIEILIIKQNYKTLDISIVPLAEIPDWHQGAGTPAWFFIDEILIE